VVRVDEKMAPRRNPPREVAGPRFDEYGIRTNDPTIAKHLYRCPVTGREQQRNSNNLRRTALAYRRLLTEHPNDAHAHLHDNYRGSLERGTCMGLAHAAHVLLYSNVPDSRLYNTHTGRMLRDTPTNRAVVAGHAPFLPLHLLSQLPDVPLQWRRDHETAETAGGYRRERVNAPWLYQQSMRLHVTEDADPTLGFARRLAIVTRDRARALNTPVGSRITCAIDLEISGSIGSHQVTLDDNFVEKMTSELFDIFGRYNMEEIAHDTIFRTSTFLYRPPPVVASGRTGRRSEQDLLKANGAVVGINTRGANQCALFCVAMHRAYVAVRDAPDDSEAKLDAQKMYDAWSKSMKPNRAAGKRIATKKMTIFDEVDLIILELDGHADGANDKGLTDDALQQVAGYLDQPIVVLKGDYLSGNWLFPRCGSIEPLIDFQSELSEGYIAQCLHEGTDAYAVADWCIMIRYDDHVHFVRPDKVAAMMGGEEICWGCRCVYACGRPHVCGSVKEDAAKTDNSCKTSRPFVTRVERDPKEAENRVAKIVVYDFESDTVTHPDREHVVNLVCYQCIDLTGDEPKLLKEGSIRWNPGNDFVKHRHQVVDDFVKMLVEDKVFTGAHVYAHNAARYDSKFILTSLQRGGLNPSYLIANGGVINIRLQKNKLQFKDSLRVIPLPLHRFPVAFDLECGPKGDFPHMYNTVANMDTTGPMPDIDFWELNMKKPNARREIETWYEERSKTSWDNFQELENYCKQDVHILAQGLIKFRQGVIDVSGFDPLCYLTQASCAIAQSTHKYLPAGCELDVEVSEKTFSMEQHAWMCGIMEMLGRVIEENYALKMFPAGREEALAAACAHPCKACSTVDNPRRMSIATSATSTNKGRLYWASTCCKPHRGDFAEWYTPGDEEMWKEGDTKCPPGLLEASKKGRATLCTVDGYDPVTETIYEWDGCYWHGHDCPAGNKNKKAERIRKETDDRHVLFRANYNLVVARSCQESRHLSDEHRKSYIHPQHALFGGHVDAYRTVTELEHLPPGCKIRYFDVVSLYPCVTVFDRLPHKKAMHLTGRMLERTRGRQPEETLKSFVTRICQTDAFFGMLKVDVTMKDRHVSILPDKRDGRLHFDSESKTEVVYCSTELLFALQKDQVESIDKLHGALVYEAYTGPDRIYASQWLRVKWACSGEKTQDECDEFNSMCARTGLVMDPVTPDQCTDNPAMRQIAKIFLNALWGKRGEREHNDITVTCYDDVDVFKHAFHPQTKKVEIAYEGVDAQGKPYVELKVYKDMPFGRPMKYANAAACAFTTANARVRLHKLLLRLHPSQLTYCDTDSCIYYVDPTNVDHWDPETQPDPEIPLGDGLGEWEDEMKISAKDRKAGVVSKEIIGVIVLGPKSYCLKVLTKYADGRYNYERTFNYQDGTVTLIGNVSEDVKAKGITLNDVNAKAIHYESMRSIAFGETKQICAKMFAFVLKGHGGTITTNPNANRVLRSNLHKRYPAPDVTPEGEEEGQPYMLYPPKRYREMLTSMHARAERKYRAARAFRAMLSSLRARVGEKRPR
jgi:hypothetical protein